MNHIIKIFLLSALFSQMAFAVSCDHDKRQMDEQIEKYETITTPGCPPDKLSYGINKIVEVMENDSACSATCKFVKGPAAINKPCKWDKGNWGDTLTCG